MRIPTQPFACAFPDAEESKPWIADPEHLHAKRCTHEGLIPCLVDRAKIRKIGLNAGTSDGIHIFTSVWCGRWEYIVYGARPEDLIAFAGWYPGQHWRDVIPWEYRQKLAHCSQCLADVSHERMRAHEMPEDGVVWTCDSPECVAGAEEMRRDVAYFERQKDDWARLEDILAEYDR